MSLWSQNELADPSQLEPYSPDGVLQVVIETPKGSRNKYTFDHRRRVMVLNKLLPAGMRFPYDFGFVPSTLAEDDDPMDVLVLMEEATFPGCVVEVRVIGAIMGENVLPSGKTYRNDRVLGVAMLSQTYENIHAVHDLPQRSLDHMQEFFATYPRLLGGKPYHVLGVQGPEEAGKLIEEARGRAS